MIEFGFDQFNRANNASSLGSADVGGAWTTQAGTGTISSNAASFTSYTTLGSGDPLGLATIDYGWSDGYVQVTVPSAPPTFSGGQGLGFVFRYSSNTNFIFGFLYGDTGDSNHNLYLRKVASGVDTDLISALNINAVTYPAVFKVTFQGSTIKVFINGVQQGSTQTDSFNSTATKHGLAAYNSSQAIDTFVAESFVRQNRVLG